MSPVKNVLDLPCGAVRPTGNFQADLKTDATLAGRALKIFPVAIHYVPFTVVHIYIFLREKY